MRGDKATFIILLAVLAVFVVSLVNLFVLRFRLGDVLPPYSSLRADPLGAKVLYEALKSLDLEVSRNFGSLNKLETRLESASRAAVFHLGSHPLRLEWAGRSYFQALEAMAVQGGRLIIAFEPIREAKFFLKKSRKKAVAEKQKQLPEQQGEKKETPKQKKRNMDKKTRRPKDRIHTLETLGRRWGFTFKTIDRPKLSPDGLAQADGDFQLPPQLPWHTVLCFDNLHSSWRVVYRYAGRPVLIERAYGRGSIVLSADSYFFSNEALRESPPSKLLAWLIGGSPETRPAIVFEETHLGVKKQPGVAALARQYRLHGLIAGFLVLAGLFIWKKASSLVPPQDDAAGEQGIFRSQLDSTAGLVSLLHRNLSERDLLAVCFQEWRKHYALSRNQDKLTAEVEKLLETPRSSPGGRTDQAAVYRKISQILAEGRPWKKRRTS